jgi:hypothetical protein
MAGSIKWFVYEDDSGVQFAIKLDESNTEAVNGNSGDYLPNSTIPAGVPRNVRVREVFYSDPTRTRTIRCVPLNLSNYQNVLGGDIPTIPDPITPGFTLTLVRANGEKRTIPFAQDTGIIDEDDT